MRAWHPAVADWERQRVRNRRLAGPGESVRRRVDRPARRYRSHGRGRPGEGDAARTGADAEGCTPRQRDLELDALSGCSPPQIAVISCGRGNRFGHPSPVVLARYRATGAAIYRTDEQGAITMRPTAERSQSLHSCARRPPGRRTHRSRSRQLSDDGSRRPSTAASGCLAHPASDGRHRCQLRGLLHGHENRKTENGQPGHRHAATRVARSSAQRRSGRFAPPSDVRSTCTARSAPGFWRRSITVQWVSALAAQGLRFLNEQQVDVIYRGHRVGFQRLDLGDRGHARCRAQIR